MIRLRRNLLCYICLILFLAGACSPRPSADYYERDGIVSIDITGHHETSNWKHNHHINSSGLLFKTVESDSSKAVEFTFHLSNSGSYSLWILTTGHNVEDAENRGDITITGPDGFIADRFRLEIPEDDRLRWVNHSEGGVEARLIELASRGFYTIRIHPGDVESVQIHKIHMSVNDYLKPYGPGLPSSVSPDINSAELLREEARMLPPDWYFGLVLGTDNEPEIETIRNTRTNNPVLLPDALWGNVASEHSAERIINVLKEIDIVPGFDLVNRYSANSGTRYFFDIGYRFAGTDNALPPEEVDELFSEQTSAHSELERGLLIRSLSKSHYPGVWQYPVLSTAPTTISWSSPPVITSEKYYPGGLKQIMETVSDPLLSTFNVPFLSIPVDLENGRPGENEELLIRKLQLAAFLPVMHLKTYVRGDLLFDFLTPQQIEVFNHYTQFRRKLFPYIYTHAHITRQRGNGIIRGFGDHPGQFRFGDAFVVAPITEQGIRERSVYLPGEGSWYDMNTGRRYRAGQSWIVEAPLNRIPLFVKAGSVIPFRAEGGIIRNGDNDRLIIEIYTGDAGTFRLTEDDGLTRDYRRGKAARTMLRYNEVAGQLRLTIGAVQSEYTGMNKYRSYELRFKHAGQPQEVMIDDEVLEEGLDSNTMDRSWSFDNVSSTLIIRLQNQWKHEKTEIRITPAE